jgi:hypothetical protein
MVNTLNENYEQMKGLVNSLSIEMDKLQNKKIKSSGLRVRASLLDIKRLCDTMRKQILVDVKAMPVRPRKKKEVVAEDEVEFEVEDEGII